MAWCGRRKPEEFAAAVAVLAGDDAPRIVRLRDEFDPTARKWTVITEINPGGASWR